MDALTVRQRQVAELAALGFSNCEIAIELSITAAVVQAELEALYRGLDGDERATTAKDAQNLLAKGET